MKKYIILLSTIMFVTSCERDVLVDVPPQTPKLVVNGIVRINTNFRVTVGKTAGILDLPNGTTYKVSNAFVQLYENNVLKDTLVYDATADAYLVKRNTRPISGRTYLVQASAPGFVTAEAETVTPNLIAIQSITRRINARKDANGNYQDEVKITFTDDGTTANYYLIKVRKPQSFSSNGTTGYSGIDCMHSSDIDIERRSNGDPTDFEYCINDEFFMTDKNFNGRTKEIILFIQHSDVEPALHPYTNKYFKPIIELHTITYDHYKYRKSYDTYRDAEDNPFAEPVLVYGNVKDGYGVFSTYDLARDTIR